MFLNFCLFVMRVLGELRSAVVTVVQSAAFANTVVPVPLSRGGSQLQLHPSGGAQQQQQQQQNATDASMQTDPTAETAKSRAAAGTAPRRPSAPSTTATKAATTTSSGKQTTPSKAGAAPHGIGSVAGRGLTETSGTRCTSNGQHSSIQQRAKYDGCVCA